MGEASAVHASRSVSDAAVQANIHPTILASGMPIHANPHPHMPPDLTFAYATCKITNITYSRVPTSMGWMVAGGHTGGGECGPLQHAFSHADARASRACNQQGL